MARGYKYKYYAFLHNNENERNKILNAIYDYNKKKKDIFKIGYGIFMEYYYKYHGYDWPREKCQNYKRARYRRTPTSEFCYISDIYKFVIICGIRKNLDNDLHMTNKLKIKCVRLNSIFGKNSIYFFSYDDYDDSIMIMEIERNRAAIILQKYIRRFLAKQYLLQIKYEPDGIEYKKACDRWNSNMNRLES